MVPISRLSVLAVLSGSKRKEGTCIESDNANLSYDVNPLTNVEEMNSDDQEGDNLSCLQNEIINEDSLLMLIPFGAR